MLMMRLQRIGRRNEAHFKVVVIEKTKGPKSQKYVDIIGSYNPKLGNVTINAEKANKWLSEGVQPSDTVRNFLISQGILEGRKVNALPKKSPTKKKNAPEVEEKPEPKVVVEEVKAPEVVEEVTEAPAEVVEETPEASEEVSEVVETPEVAEEVSEPGAEEVETPAEVVEEAPEIVTEESSEEEKEETTV